MRFMREGVKGERRENTSPLSAPSIVALCVCMSTNIENNAAVTETHTAKRRIGVELNTTRLLKDFH